MQSLLLSQDLGDFIQMAGEVVYQIIPHLRLVDMLLLAIPGPLGDSELPAALEHEGDCTLGDLHFRWRLG